PSRQMLADGADPGIDERISDDGGRLVEAALLARLVRMVEVEGIDKLIDRVAEGFRPGDRHRGDLVEILRPAHRCLRNRTCSAISGRRAAAVRSRLSPGK